MTYFLDGAPYTYGPNAGLVCAGWLGRGHAFLQGATPDRFLDRLAWLCSTQRDRPCRGIHVCELCPEREMGYVSILRVGKKRLLGAAEITVNARVRTYAAPNLILHYVAVHGYLPPDDLVGALMADTKIEELTKWSLFVGNYWD